MCYYATTDFVCGDWKWGNMMLRCPRQHRIGETCGAKLVHHESITKSATICKTCEEMGTKSRRLSKLSDNIARWRTEPDKFSASLDKAVREAAELQAKIRELNLRRTSVSTGLASSGNSSSNGRTSMAASSTAAMLPPLSSMTAPGTPGYEYASAAGLGRRQEVNGYNIPRNGNTTGVSMVSAPTAGQYANLPTGAYISSGGVPVARQGGTYAVSYARR